MKIIYEDKHILILVDEDLQDYSGTLPREVEE